MSVILCLLAAGLLFSAGCPGMHLLKPMPNLVGLSQDEAARALADAGLRATEAAALVYSDTTIAGTVVRQSPLPGVGVGPGSAVTFAVSSEPPAGAIGIHTAKELENIGSSPTYPLDGVYYLNNNIDATDTATWHSSQGFDPIDTFSGTFDGQGYQITGLRINRPYIGRTALFAGTYAKACIKNVGLADCAIIGYHDVGGLTGSNSGTITNCYFSGAVTGRDTVGGLVGLNYGTISTSYAAGMLIGSVTVGGLTGENRGRIQDCYAMGYVFANERVGGMVGANINPDSERDYKSDSPPSAVGEGIVLGSIARSYSAASVFGASYSGGLVGFNLGGIAPDSFWDTDTSRETDSPLGIGKPTKQMMTKHTFGVSNWDFASTWTLAEGQTYPHLQAVGPQNGSFRVITGTATNGRVVKTGTGFTKKAWSLTTLAAVPDPGYSFAGWMGADANDEDQLLPLNPLPVPLYSDLVLQPVFLPSGPLTISSVEELQQIGADAEHPWHWRYVLTQDIDASETAAWNNGEGFAPIGTLIHPFTGTLDGQGHVISGLTIDCPRQPYVGLFTIIGGDAHVTNLRFDHASVTSAYSYTGCLTGTNYGTLTNCEATGTVEGDEWVGGLAGRNVGTINECSAAVSVDGGLIVGGLVGDNDGSVADCHGAGLITGGSHVGGLLGENTGTVLKSHASADVSGNYEVGGLIGYNLGDPFYNYDGGVSHSFATGIVTGTTKVGGLVGASGYGTLSSNYATATVRGVGYAGGLVGSTYTTTITDSFALGAVMAVESVGGLIGSQGYGLTSNCYAAGTLIGETEVGGLIGASTQGTVTDSFWDADVTGQMNSAAGEAKTTMQMMAKEAFLSVGWDLEDIWTLLESKTYPHFQDDAPADLVYSVTIAYDPHGHVTTSGLTGEPWSLAQLTAVANPGYAFAGWCAAGLSHNDQPVLINPLPVAVYGDITITPVFLPDAPIAIANVNDLQRIGADVQHPLHWRYVLTQDIDASPSAYWNGGAGFAPIGTRPEPFSGSLDGQGHIISELTINRSQEEAVGLLGCIQSDGSIANLNLTGGSVVGYSYVGSLAGNASKVSVSNCSSSTPVEGEFYVGGLLGGSRQCNVTDCFTEGSVNGGLFTGGMVGPMDRGEMEFCVSTGDVTGEYSVGGLVGDSRGDLLCCGASGTVTAEQLAGGLIGATGGGNTTKCFASGEVFVAHWGAGGLIGSAYNSHVTDCYASNAVSGMYDVGGLIGGCTEGTLATCYAVGPVVATDPNATNHGGLIGRTYYGDPPQTATNSFWDTETSGQASSEGGTGKTTAEMVTQSTFTDAGWDFTDVWTIDEGVSYPYFRWQQ